MTSIRPATLLCFLSAIALASAGCGTAELTGTSGTPLAGDARPVPEEFALTQALGSAGRGVLFLNFDGQKVKYGGSNSKQNTSWIVPKGYTVSIPAFSPDNYGASRAEAIAAIVEMVKRDYADYDVVVTTERPSSGDYTMVLVGGYPGLIGEADETAGISPLDTGNPNHNDVVFVFPEVLFDLRELATCISHEAGHSFGLDHLQPTNAIMYPVLQPGDLQWLNARIYGESGTQNQPYILSRLFGSPTSTPTPPPANTSKDDAAFVTQDVPSSLKPGESFLASLTFRNTGSTTWRGGSGYALTSPNADFGGDTLVLPFDVAPGETKNIRFYARAPMTPGSYTFRWQLAHDGAVFGSASSSVSISVTGGNQLPVGEFEYADGDQGYGWASDADTPSAALWIDIYVDGTYAGSIQANQDTATHGRHGFLFGMPSLGGGSHLVRAYAVDDKGETAYPLKGDFYVQQ